jgi:hypothetical protein
MTTTPEKVDRAAEYDRMTPDARRAGRHLYLLGIAAAIDRHEITYEAAAASMQAAAIGSNAHNIDEGLDALAVVCARLGAPELTALYRPIASFQASKRWRIGERELIRNVCWAHPGSWPALPGDNREVDPPSA